jgi:hypothetical protein
MRYPSNEAPHKSPFDPPRNPPSSQTNLHPIALRMLANVQQTTIQPIIEATVAKGARIHTDEYNVYARLPAWGYQHKTVCHARGE